MFLTKKTGQSRALNCCLINQLATPGLGSLMGGRVLAGIGQLLVALAGFGLVLVWFLMTMVQYYNQIGGDDVPVISYARFAWAGAIVFAISWVWALFTSLSLLRHATPDDPVTSPRVPPRISSSPPRTPDESG